MFWWFTNVPLTELQLHAHACARRHSRHHAPMQTCVTTHDNEIQYQLGQWRAKSRRRRERNPCPCEMTRMIHAHRHSSNHKPLHRTARGRDAHGRDAAPGQALLAEREERRRGKCTRERHFNTFSRAWSVPGRFTPRRGVKHARRKRLLTV
eukprot:360254-Chlamydomonas_euryale.AAC.2